MALSKDFARIAAKFSENSVAIRTLLAKQDVISDFHKLQLENDIRYILAYLPDDQSARELRAILYTIKAAKPKTVTTTLYGNC